MCGIVGILLRPHTAEGGQLDAVEAMATTMHHRGPDGGGIWIDRDAGVALGHRRLAIVDVSDAGHQPMLSHSKNLIMTFNGEVYNFAELRLELEALGHHFRGHSDSEVMLAAFESFGVEKALTKFCGMFALALWNRKDRVLHLVRDRMGKKPLYIGIAGQALFFASELKAMRALPGFQPTIDANALAMMLSHGWVPDDSCIWRGVFKLAPGAMLTVSANDLQSCSSEQLQSRARIWWSLAQVAETGQRHPLDLPAPELECELDRLLRAVVRQRMVADVPLGAFLSGGIDSSMIVALMQAQSSNPVRTFTIGFDEAQFDEARHASQVAQHLGTDHTEFRLTAREARNIIPELPQIWDEPFADESQIPTFLVARLARQHVTVALSGDGGDECFGGYARHFMPTRLAPVLWLPVALRRTAAAAMLMLSPAAWKRILRAVPLPSSLQGILSGENLQRFAGMLDAADERELYERLTMFGPNPMSLAQGVAAGREVPPLPNATARVIYRDMAGYLPGDILVKLDRACMAASLESRSPFLDHRIVEFAWRLSSDVKVRRGQGKWLLRRVLRRYVPEALFDRPKQGFNVPIGDWLRGPLRDWAQDLLDTSRIRRDGILDPLRVQVCWQQHQNGRRDRSRELWAVLMVQAWHAMWRNPDPPAVAKKAVELFATPATPIARIARGHRAYG
jgi:asparagine synthase (glutamine-hydrolysing)